MKVVRTIAALETTPGTGLVPTMGALHDGHVALLQAARQENRTVVMSLFVNPAQFDEQADLAAYPRNEARDDPGQCVKVGNGSPQCAVGIQSPRMDVARCVDGGA